MTDSEKQKLIAHLKSNPNDIDSFVNDLDFEDDETDTQEPLQTKENSLEKFPADAQNYIKELREENKKWRLKLSELENNFTSIQREKATAEAEAENRKLKKLETEGNWETLYKKLMEKLESMADYNDLKSFKDTHSKKQQALFEQDLARLQDEEAREIYSNLGMQGHEALKRYLKTIEAPGIAQSIGSEKRKTASGVPTSLEGMGMDDLAELSTMHPDVYKTLVQKAIRTT